MLAISADQQSSATLRLRYAPRPIVSSPTSAPSHLKVQNVVRAGRQYGGVMAIAPSPRKRVTTAGRAIPHAPAGEGPNTTSAPELIGTGKIVETVQAVDLKATLANWWVRKPSFAQPAEGDTA